MIQNLLTDINAAVRQYVADLPHVSPDKAGIDRRAGSGLWIGEDCVIVRKNDKRGIEYYGHFEYVNDKCRIDTGEYVIYCEGREEDDSVRECINTFIGRGE